MIKRNNVIVRSLASCRECVMAFMRVPSLEEEFGRDAAMMLNTLGWGKDLLGRALGRDAEGRLVSNDDKNALHSIPLQVERISSPYGCFLHFPRHPPPRPPA